MHTLTWLTALVVALAAAYLWAARPHDPPRIPGETRAHTMPVGWSCHADGFRCPTCTRSKNRG